MARQFNPRLAKIHRNYTVDEVAQRWGLHRNTVRHWIKLGLPTIDRGRPVLIHGQDLADFLAARRQANRRRCSPGEIYCVRCREARRPAGGVVHCQSLTQTQGTLVGTCPECNCRIFRRVNLSRLDEVRGGLEVRLTDPLARIDESTQPSVNSDFAP
jgi:excisionase family DNA binding protein